MSNISYLPLVWFSGNRYMKSDLPWVQSQLSRLPLKAKAKASEEYTRIYLNKLNSGEGLTAARMAANTFLAEYCNGNGLTREEAALVRNEPDIAKASALFDKLIELKKLSRQKKSILGIADKLKRK